MEELLADALRQLANILIRSACEGTENTYAADPLYLKQKYLQRLTAFDQKIRSKSTQFWLEQRNGQAAPMLNWEMFHVSHVIRNSTTALLITLPFCCCKLRYTFGGTFTPSNFRRKVHQLEKDPM